MTKLVCRSLITDGGVVSHEVLDSLGEEVQLLSPLVDDVVSELPAPVDSRSISQMVSMRQNFSVMDDGVSFICTGANL